jgi:drug/metabolite transporter (DMT)-like permease
MTLAALAGAFVGCYLVVGAYHFNVLALSYLGIISGILSALAFAWYSLQGEYGMRRYPLGPCFFTPCCSAPSPGISCSRLLGHFYAAIPCCSGAGSALSAYWGRFCLLVFISKAST